MIKSRSVVKGVQLTEKASTLSDKENKYFFKVDPSANKMEIKKEVEKVFGVSVSAVNTMRYTGKKKRERTVRYGKKSDWKRAVVTLSKGSRMDLT